MASRVAALLLLGVICFGFAAAEIVTDCCLSTASKRLPSKILVDYIIQEAGKGCDISATVFITVAGNKLCVDHPKDNQRVQNLINNLKQRKQ